ncbi:MAG: hypothetical protein B6241_11890 [Spirochaetaceae bacterium 4572_59]|nr:MAG: hypothetical protein B6241_11890 [Spirochaetaceae bacterium 4572_59]
MITKENFLNFTKRQSEIIDVTIDLIAKGGIQNFTMKSLAEDIGISEPAIYRHFKSKLEILIAILESVREDVQKVDSQNDIYKKGTMVDIDKMLQMQIQRFIQKPSLASIIFSEEIFQNEKQLSNAVLEIMNDRCGLMEMIIQREQDLAVIRNDISAHTITQIIMGTVRFLVNKWNLSGNEYDLNQEYLENWAAVSKMIMV